MLYRHREGRRVALSSLWRSAPNLRIPSDHLEPVCNCPLRRRGTDVYHILVLAGVLETYKNFASLLCFCVVKICTQHRSGVASISTILARPSNGLARQGIDASAVTEQRACT